MGSATETQKKYENPLKSQLQVDLGREELNLQPTMRKTVETIQQMPFREPLSDKKDHENVNIQIQIEAKVETKQAKRSQSKPKLGELKVAKVSKYNTLQKENQIFDIEQVAIKNKIVPQIQQNFQPRSKGHLTESKTTPLLPLGINEYRENETRGKKCRVSKML